MEELLTISRFAELAGVSPQAVYKQLSNRLRGYCKLVDGKKMLLRKALSDVYDIDDQPEDNQLQAETDAKPPVVFEVEKTIPILQEQVRAKDQQIDALQEQMRVKDKQIDALHNIIERINRICEQQNTLSLSDKQTLLQLTTRRKRRTKREPKWYEFWK